MRCCQHTLVYKKKVTRFCLARHVWTSLYNIFLFQMILLQLVVLATSHGRKRGGEHSGNCFWTCDFSVIQYMPAMAGSVFEPWTDNRCLCCNLSFKSTVLYGLTFPWHGAYNYRRDYSGIRCSFRERSSKRGRDSVARFFDIVIFKHV